VGKKRRTGAEGGIRTLYQVEIPPASSSLFFLMRLIHLFFLAEKTQFILFCSGLRVWFTTEMGECLIPDRFVDIFQGRAPRSVLAKHYTGKGLQRLKRIYDKANLKI